MEDNASDLRRNLFIRTEKVTLRVRIANIVFGLHAGLINVTDI